MVRIKINQHLIPVPRLRPMNTLKKQKTFEIFVTWKNIWTNIKNTNAWCSFVIAIIQYHSPLQSETNFTHVSLQPSHRTQSCSSNTCKDQSNRRFNYIHTHINTRALLSNSIALALHIEISRTSGDKWQTTIQAKYGSRVFKSKREKSFQIVQESN